MKNESSEEVRLLPLKIHLEELRSLLIKTLVLIGVATFTAFYFSEIIIDLFLKTIPPPQGKLAVFSPQEGFFSLCKLSFWIAALGTSPLWVSLLLQFLRPALKKSEKKLLYPFIALSFLFISLGLFFCFRWTLPLANSYLFSFNLPFSENLWGLASYIDFAFLLLFAHGIAFEIGAILLFLIHLKVLSSKEMGKKRRHAAIAALILGALLTPPDVPSQLMVALPLYTFFEIAILYGKMVNFRALSHG